MVIAAVLLHTGIALSMGLVGFGLIMLALLLSFVPAETMKEWLREWQGKRIEPAAPPEPQSRAA